MFQHKRPSDSSELFVITSLGILLTLLYGKFFLPYLPNESGRMGHDWSYVLPSLLNGFFWHLENGAFSIPWFTPAKCAGYAFYATDYYFSLAGILSWFMSPVHSVQITFLIFADIGFLGFYLFMRRSLNASMAAALLTATLFMFNGFSSHRMLIGHYAFHGFLLTPLIAFIVTAPTRSRILQMSQVAGVGLLFAYMVHSAMIQILPPTILAIACLVLLKAALQGWSIKPWLLFLSGGLAGIAISANKLIAFTSLTDQFPRSYYPLPGISNLLLLAKSVFIGFYLPVPDDIGSTIVNSAFTIARHEWEFGLSPIPFALIVASLILALRKLSLNSLIHGITKEKIISISAIALIAITPILLNWYDPYWNSLLKQIPFIKSSSSLVRWLVLEIPLICCLAGLSVDFLSATISKSHESKPVWLICGLGLFGVLLYNGAVDRSYYNQGYSSGPVERAWREAYQSKAPPPISQIAIQVVGNGPNDGLTIGVSPIICYEPTMGYRLEKFPVAPLNQGAVFPEKGDLINLKNPACYTYPDENHCKPGDHFKVNQRPAAEALTRYHPFEFEYSFKQKIANFISGSSLIIALGILLCSLIKKLHSAFD